MEMVAIDRDKDHIFLVKNHPRLFMVSDHHNANGVTSGSYQ